MRNLNRVTPASPRCRASLVMASPRMLAAHLLIGWGEYRLATISSYRRRTPRNPRPAAAPSRPAGRRAGGGGVRRPLPQAVGMEEGLGNACAHAHTKQGTHARTHALRLACTNAHAPTTDSAARPAAAAAAGRGGARSTRHPGRYRKPAGPPPRGPARGGLRAAFPAGGARPGGTGATNRPGLDGSCVGRFVPVVPGGTGPSPPSLCQTASLQCKAASGGRSQAGPTGPAVKLYLSSVTARP